MTKNNCVSIKGLYVTSSKQNKIRLCSSHQKISKLIEDKKDHNILCKLKWFSHRKESTRREKNEILWELIKYIVRLHKFN